MDECQNVIAFDDLDSIDIDDATDDNMVNTLSFYCVQERKIFFINGVVAIIVFININIHYIFCEFMASNGCVILLFGKRKAKNI